MERSRVRHTAAPGIDTRAVKALFDTNILLDYLNGIEAARAEIDRAGERYVSIVTWMEILAGAHGTDEEDAIELFLRDFTVVELTRRIAREAVAIRRSHRMRMPVALVWASARSESAVLVTRNTKDFAKSEPGVRVPYTL